MLFCQRKEHWCNSVRALLFSLKAALIASAVSVIVQLLLYMHKRTDAVIYAQAYRCTRLGTSCCDICTSVQMHRAWHKLPLPPYQTQALFDAHTQKHTHLQEQPSALDSLASAEAALAAATARVSTLHAQPTPSTQEEAGVATEAAAPEAVARPRLKSKVVASAAYDPRCVFVYHMLCVLCIFLVQMVCMWVKVMPVAR